MDEPAATNDAAVADRQARTDRVLLILRLFGPAADTALAVGALPLPLDAAHAQTYLGCEMAIFGRATERQGGPPAAALADALAAWLAAAPANFAPYLVLRALTLGYAIGAAAATLAGRPAGAPAPAGDGDDTVITVQAVKP